MSETELHIGKIREVPLNNKTINEVASELCIENNIDWTDENSPIEALVNYTYPSKYHYVNGKLYEIIHDDEYSEAEYVQTLTKNEDGEYEYVMRFYNGDTCLNEMLYEALNSI